MFMLMFMFMFSGVNRLELLGSEDVDAELVRPLLRLLPVPEPSGTTRCPLAPIAAANALAEAPRSPCDAACDSLDPDMEADEACPRPVKDLRLRTAAGDMSPNPTPAALVVVEW